MQILDDDKIMQALLIKIEDLTNDVHCLKRTIIKVRTSQEQPKKFHASVQDKNITGAIKVYIRKHGASPERESEKRQYA